MPSPTPRKLRIAANIGTLLLDRAPLERPEAAAEAGFQGVVMAEPWDLPAQDFRDRLTWAKLPLVSLRAPPPNYAGGDPGWAGVPTTTARFRSDLRRVLRLAGVLRPEAIVLCPGPETDPGALAQSLAHAVEAAPRQTFLLPCEPDHLPLAIARRLTAGRDGLGLLARAEDLGAATDDDLRAIRQITAGEETELLDRLGALDWTGWIVAGGEGGAVPPWLRTRLAD